MTIQEFYTRHDTLIAFFGVLVAAFVFVAAVSWFAFAPVRSGGEEPSTLVRQEWYGGITPLQDFPTGTACDNAAEPRGWRYFCVPRISEKYANWNAGKVIVNRRIMP